MKKRVLSVLTTIAFLGCTHASAGMVFYANDYYASSEPRHIGEPIVVLSEEEYQIYGGTVTIRPTWEESDSPHYFGDVLLGEQGIDIPVRFVRTEHTFVDLLYQKEYLGFEYLHGESTCDVVLAVHSDNNSGLNQKAVVDKCRDMGFAGGIGGLDNQSGWALDSIEEIYQITASALGVYQSNSYGRWHWRHHFHEQGYLALMSALFYQGYEGFYQGRDTYDYGIELRGAYKDINYIGTYSDMVMTDINYAAFNYDSKLASGVGVSRESSFFVGWDKDGGNGDAVTVLSRDYKGSLPVSKVSSSVISEPNQGWLFLLGSVLLFGWRSVLFKR